MRYNTSSCRSSIGSGPPHEALDLAATFFDLGHIAFANRIRHVVRPLIEAPGRRRETVAISKCLGPTANAASQLIDRAREAL